MRRQGPHVFPASFCRAEGFRTQGAIDFDTLADDLVTGFARIVNVPAAASERSLEALELSAPHGIELDRNHRGIVCEMFKHASTLGHVTIQHGLAIVLVTTPQDVVMSTCHDLDGVELHKTEVVDYLFEIQRAGWRRRKALGAEKQASRVSVADSQGCCHRKVVVKSAGRLLANSQVGVIIAEGAPSVAQS